jgi:hypothetical protein
MDLFFMCNHCGVEIKIATSQPGPVLSCPLCSTINHPPAQRLEHGSILAGYRILHRIEATVLPALPARNTFRRPILWIAEEICILLEPPCTTC